MMHLPSVRPKKPWMQRRTWQTLRGAEGCRGGFEQDRRPHKRWQCLWSMSGRGITIHRQNKNNYGKEQTNPNEVARHGRYTIYVGQKKKNPNWDALHKVSSAAEYLNGHVVEATGIFWYCSSPLVWGTSSSLREINFFIWVSSTPQKLFTGSKIQSMLRFLCGHEMS